VTTDWLEVAGIPSHDVPDIIVLEGSWWRSQRERQRLSRLCDPRPLAAPDWWLGGYGPYRVLYACLYGAARAVEPVLMVGTYGTRAVVQIGSCGGLQPSVHTGDLLVPAPVLGADGVSTQLSPGPSYSPTAGLVTSLETAAARTGEPLRLGPTVSECTLSQLRPQDLSMAQWVEEGYLGVDLETASVYAAAERVGVGHAAVLYVWDEHWVGRNWSDPLPLEVENRRAQAEIRMFDIALEGATAYLG